MSELILYTTADGLTKINVKLENETVWLTIDQMAELFNKSRSTINEHILNIYQEGELSDADTMRKIGISDFSTKPTKALAECKKYKAKNLSSVEKEYLKTITALEKQAKQADKLSKANSQKGGKA